MALLDKAGEANTTVAKKAAAPKAVAKAAAPKVAAAAKTAAPKAAKTSTKKPRSRKPKAARGLPEGFVLPGKIKRGIGGLSNFTINYGVLVAAIVMNVMNSNATILFAVGALVYLLNTIFIPGKFGRNFGQFLSGTRYVNDNGEKPNPMHSILNNMMGAFFFASLAFIIVNMSKLSNGKAGPVIWFSVGLLLFAFVIFNWWLRKNNEYRQGAFDWLFRAYLVTYIPTGDEATSGLGGFFNSIGDYGEKFSSSREQKAEKAAAKKEAKALARAEAARAKVAEAEAAAESED